MFEDRQPQAVGELVDQDEVADLAASGSIDADGILNGSARNERSRKTIRRTGKKLFGYSIHHGSRAPCARLRAMQPSARRAPLRRSSAVARSRMQRESSSSLSMPRRRCDCQPVRAIAQVSDAACRAIVDVPARSRDPAQLSHAGHFCRRPAGSRGTPPAGSRRCRLLHALLARLLLLEQLLLARDVAAVALGEHVLAQRLDRLARDDVARRSRPGPRRRTSGAGSARASSTTTSRPRYWRIDAVHDDRQRVDLLAVDQDVELDDVGRAEFLELVVERRIAARRPTSACRRSPARLRPAAARR